MRQRITSCELVRCDVDGELRAATCELLGCFQAQSRLACWQKLVSIRKAVTHLLHSIDVALRGVALCCDALGSQVGAVERRSLQQH